MAGAGYKLFATGDVLTAAQVNTYLQEQAVMRFASAAARTTALSGVLAEGMVSYLDDVNQVQVYNGSAWVAVGGSSPLTTKGDVYTYSTADARLAVGTNGQVLTADSTTATGLKWAAVSSGTKSYSLINSGGTSLSGSSTTVSSISGMDNLYVAIIGASCTAADIEIQVQINADSGANYTSAGVAYVWGSTYAASNYNGGGGYSNGTLIEVGRMSSGAATSTVSAGLWINGANTTGEKFYHSIGGGTATGSNGQRFYHNTGMWENTATVSSIKVIASGGTFDAGTVYVWGSA